MAESVSSLRASERSGDPDPAVSEWIAGARAGDGGAFEKIYREHVGRVYGLCLRLVADPVEAEILTQDVFVRAWEKLGLYEGRGSFAAWLRRLAVNVVVDRGRVESRRTSWLEADGNAAPDSEPLPAAGSPRVEVAIDLERAIAGLPPGARRVFVLHDVYGYGHGEIAAMAGTALGTAKAQLNRARKLLRAALGGTEGGE